MRTKIYSVIILVCMQISFAFAQDMHFTQFFASPLYLNPAFTGANVCSRVSLVYRNQWPEIKKAYNSYLVSYDHFLTAQKVGVGLQIGVDYAGSGGLRTTIINPSIAYEAKIFKTIGIRAGFQPGVTMKSIRFDKLLFGDQLARGGNVDANSITTVETPTQTRTFFDMGAGFLIYSKKSWIGVSAFHLNKPNESFYEDLVAELPIKYSVHGGTKFMLNPDEKDPDLRKSVSMVFNYRGQGKFDQFDIGVYYSQFVFNFGVWYRGIPGLKAYKPGYSNNDAVAFILGFQKETFSVGYSYDLTISQLHRLTNGAHEITLSYQFCKPKKKKNNRIVVSCPKF